MIDETPGLQENRTGILTTGSNRTRQQQGSVDNRDIFGSGRGGRGGLRRRGTHKNIKL